VVTRTLSPEGKVTGHEAGQLPPYAAEVKNEWSYIVITFACCELKYSYSVMKIKFPDVYYI
jgi:hypothetical protein